MYSTLSEAEIEALIGKLSDDERNILFVNDLREGLFTKAEKYRELYIIHFPYSLILFGEVPEDCQSLAVYIMSLKTRVIIAPEPVMLAVSPCLSGYSMETRRMMTITPEHFRKKERDTRLKVLRTKEDFLALFSLYRKVAEMAESFPECEDGENLDTFLSKPFPFTAVALFENGEAVSGGYISNPSRLNAMISCIATAPEHRNKGFATSVVSELLDISFGENMMKRLSLWYTNEEAGRIYRSLGFRDAGTWIRALEVKNEICENRR